MSQGCFQNYFKDGIAALAPAVNLHFFLESLYKFINNQHSAPLKAGDRAEETCSLQAPGETRPETPDFHP